LPDGTVAFAGCAGSWFCRPDVAAPMLDHEPVS
jgi:hypothetical protein